MFSDGLEVAPLVPREISHYRIIDKLGSGGMGEVFLAQDVRLDRKVAIKMLPAKLIGNEQAKKRLFREAKAAATLDHPNICAIYEVGEEGDCAYIAMQYIEGRTLSHMIKNNALSPLEVVDIGIQTAEALAEAHSRGVLHRDIKPQNVIITPRGQVKILDFGLAKILRDENAIHTGELGSRLTETGEVVGTVGYMSPEQLRDLPLDARSDLFSLGVMLYECATGKSAFVGSTKIQISLQIIEVDPKRPSELSAQVPNELDAIILKALEKDVAARYQSAGEMLADLRRMENVLQGSIVNTRPLTPPRRSFREPPGVRLSTKLRRTPINLKVAVAVLVPLIILGIWLALLASNPSLHQPSPEAKTWYERGTAAMRAGTYYQASKALERSIEIDDRFALAHARLAETYLEVDNTDKATQEMLNALSLVPNRSALTTADSKYLDALAAKVRREFPKAIEYYRELADKSQDPDKASALVDLGRAYEKNEQIDKAQESYLEATKKDSQSAAGFLRLAIIYGRRQDLKNAEDAFNDAEKIYAAMQSQEGLAEVSYQRGALLAKVGRVADAKKQLEKVLDIVQNADNKYQLVKTQLQLSAVYYKDGNSDRAKQLATDAIALARSSNIHNLATNGLIDLGYTFLNLGEFVEADKYFRQALDFAQRDKTQNTEARAKLALGTLNQIQGNTDGAISQLDEALKFYQPGGYRKETSIALLMLGRAYRDKGDYEVAFKTFEQQLGLAQDLGDPAQVSATHMSLAILRGVEQERYPEALSHLDEGYKIDESRGAKVQMGFDQMRRGSFLWQIGRYDDARSALDQALSIANRPEASYKEVLAWVHLTDSQMLLSQRRFAEAKAKGRLALELAGSQYRDVALQAKYTIGRAEASMGATQEARKLCEEAVGIAKEIKTPRLISSALLALAEVLLLGKEPQSAVATAMQAQSIFAAADQGESEWRAWVIAARANELAGNKSAMQDCASRADKVCAGLRTKWGDEAYDKYLSRPDILGYRSQIDQILTRSK